MSAADAARHTIADYLGDWRPGAVVLSSRPDFVVAQDGSGTHRSVQAALDAVPATGRRHFIFVRTGVYREQLCFKGPRAPLTLWGEVDVRIVQGQHAARKANDSNVNRCVAPSKNGTVGTAGSATAAFFSADVQLARLTIANDAMDAVRNGVGYPEDAAESGGAQAVALMLEGDRIQLEEVRLLGHQDTLYARAGRMLVRKSVIAGDVDFIFGGATLVIDQSAILSRAGRRQPGAEARGGHVLAPSTAWDQPYGFLIVNSYLIAEPGVPANSISIGRAWDAGVPKGEWQANRSPNGQALVRDSHLGPHLAPWAASTSRRPYEAAINRMSEYANRVDAGAGGPLDPR